MSSPVPLHVPGFVDLQVNGFVGIDFSSEALTEEAFLHAGHALIGRGTAAFLPTLITGSEARLRRNLTLIGGALKKDATLARHVLGFHLEGPFISDAPGAVGAHDPAAVVAPDCGLFDRLFAWSQGRLRLLTVAAEQAGAPALAHLSNGMPNLAHRHNNPLLAGLAEERLSVLFIPDGHHLPRHVLKVFARAAGPQRLVATSDASPAAGLPPGTYEVLGNRAILEPSGLLHNPEKQCLVGSSATLLACMNVLHGLGLFTLEDLLRIGFSNPLALIGCAPQEVPTCQHALAFSPESGFTLV